jgi:uncharacterized membrane protein YdjX (TVP38/TMEM64 family)
MPARSAGELKFTSRTVGWVFGVLLIVGLAIEGHHLAGFVPEAEHAIEKLGPWGPLSYVLAIIALQPVLFPNFIFGLIGGAVFGLWKGYVYYFGAIYVANMLVYLVGKRLLRGPVLRELERRPKIRDAASVASSGGPGLVFWLRMIPTSPAILSYALGALRVMPRSVAIGTLGIAPHVFLDVYLGTVAAHVTQMAGEGHTSWEAKGIALVFGLFAVAAATWQITRVARVHIDAASEAKQQRDSASL